MKNYISMLLLVFFLFSGCNQIEKSKETDQETIEAKQTMVFEKRELSEKLISLDRKIDGKIDRVQDEVIKTDGEKQEELADRNEWLIEGQSLVKSRIALLDNRDKIKGWEELRKETQIMIDTLNDQLSKF